jgi:hypothetical protein
MSSRKPSKSRQQSVSKVLKEAKEKSLKSGTPSWFSTAASTLGEHFPLVSDVVKSTAVADATSYLKSFGQKFTSAERCDTYQIWIPKITQMIRKLELIQFLLNQLGKLYSDTTFNTSLASLKSGLNRYLEEIRIISATPQQRIRGQQCINSTDYLILTRTETTIERLWELLVTDLQETLKNILSAWNDEVKTRAESTASLIETATNVAKQPVQAVFVPPPSKEIELDDIVQTNSIGAILPPTTVSSDTNFFDDPSLSTPHSNAVRPNKSLFDDI